MRKHTALVGIRHLDLHQPREEKFLHRDQEGASKQRCSEQYKHSERTRPLQDLLTALGHHKHFNNSLSMSVVSGQQRTVLISSVFAFHCPQENNISQNNSDFFFWFYFLKQLFSTGKIFQLQFLTRILIKISPPLHYKVLDLRKLLIFQLLDKSQCQRNGRSCTKSAGDLQIHLQMNPKWIHRLNPAIRPKVIQK